ncbi:MAG TPA: alpha/beta fold hydrolase [Chroococcales cyanobacterium]
MKFKILIGVLCLSLLANAAGIVFLCLYVGQLKRVKTIKRENYQLRNNLSIVKSAGMITDLATSDRLSRRAFISQFDGEEDAFALCPAVLSGPAREITLIVYLHGMGSTLQEPFLFPKDHPLAFTIVDHKPKTVLLSCSYRKEASWGSDAAVADITQNIREICQQYPVKRIILMGSSMGGCVALTYAATAPQDIKEKLIGVVSCESTGDLAKLFQTTKLPGVQVAMVNAFGGMPDQLPQIYQNKSFIPNIDKLPSGTRIALISAKKDTTVPTQLQHDLIDAMNEHHVANKLIEVDQPHGNPPVEVFMDGLDFVLAGH